MNKLIALLLGIFIVFSSTVDTSSAWNYSLKSGDYTGSSTISTSYKNLEITVNRTKGYPTVKIQKLSGGSWEDITGEFTLSSMHQSKTLKLKPKSKGVQFRVFIQSPPALIGGDGTISYKTYN